MPPKWLYNRPVEDQRYPASFPRYPDPLPDPQGVLARWLDLVQITPISAKEWRCRPGWFLRPRVGGDSFWFCFPDGSGRLFLDEGRCVYEFKPGDLLLVAKGRQHRVVLEPGTRAHFFAVHFFATIYGSIDLLDLIGFPAHAPAARDSPFVEVSHRLARAFAIQRPGWAKNMAAEICNLLIHLLNHHGRYFCPRQGVEAHQHLLRVLPVVQFVEQHLMNPQLSVTDLARVISVSEVHLRKLMRQATGASPVVFLQRQRCHQAGLLLRTTNLSIKQVAEKTGFAAVPFFHTVFKRWTGQTPAAYRTAKEV